MAGNLSDNPLVPETTAPIATLLRPFQRFARLGTAGGILLFAASIIAVAVANSPWAPAYERFWHIAARIQIADLVLGRDLHFFINDGLMGIFFFVVGLEIKREMLAGELTSLRQAALPIAGAIGGALIPAAIFWFLNRGGDGAAGWGIPMATDIAFVIGFLALLGSRVPTGLKVFVTALAIVDDILAVLVIAVFYTGQVEWEGLAVAAFLLLLLFAANLAGIRHPVPYGIVGFALWIAVLYSGIHATIAGVLAAMAIPARTELDAGAFLANCRRIIRHFERSADPKADLMVDIEQQIAINALEDSCEKAQPPLYRLETALHPWVSFVIMPLFAFANAGVHLEGESSGALSSTVAQGILFGLLFGKPLGIFLACRLAVRFGLAALPVEVSWRQVHGAGWLAGIGFTMSLFVAALAFPDGVYLTQAKTGVLAGSLISAAVGVFILTRTPPPLRSSAA